MKCDTCNSNISITLEDYYIDTKQLGRIAVPSIEQFKCSSCGEISLSAKESKKVTDFVNKQIEDAIKNIPIGRFISANQTKRLLGISKQALSKSNRINRGFIYFIVIDERKYYDRESVEAYKKTGDGRIQLSHQEQENYPELKIFKRHSQEELSGIWALSGFEPGTFVSEELPISGELPGAHLVTGHARTAYPSSGIAIYIHNKKPTNPVIEPKFLLGSGFVDANSLQEMEASEEDSSSIGNKPVLGVSSHG